MTSDHFLFNSLELNSEVICLVSMVVGVGSTKYNLPISRSVLRFTRDIYIKDLREDPELDNIKRLFNILIVLGYDNTQF